MRRFGLIGHPLSHSFSKPYFTTKFEKEGISDAVYENYELASITELPEVLQTEGLQGLNVTIPYKEQVLPYLTELDPIAEAVGAVNCIRIDHRNGQPFLKGYNTDVFGFSSSIKPFLEPKHARALILGTGGASKAVACALRRIGVEVYFVTSSGNAKENHFSYEQVNAYVMQAFGLIVNTTPLGMFPNLEECPPIPYEYLTSEHLVYDLIYNPEETRFLMLAKEKGATVINGLNMLRLQAEKGWEIWNSRQD